MPFEKTSIPFACFVSINFLIWPKPEFCLLRPSKNILWVQKAVPKGKVLSIVSLSWEANCGPSNLWQIIFTSIANRCISWALFAIVSKFYNFVSFFPLNQKSVISYKEKKIIPISTADAYIWSSVVEIVMVPLTKKIKLLIL